MKGEITAGVAPAKEEKHLILLKALRQVQEVVDQLDDLNRKLGVYKQRIVIPAAVAASSAAIPPPEVPKDPVPDTLVAVLEHLPDKLNAKVNKLHDMLNDLENSLI